MRNWQKLVALVVLGLGIQAHADSSFILVCNLKNANSTATAVIGPLSHGEQYRPETTIVLNQCLTSECYNSTLGGFKQSTVRQDLVILRTENGDNSPGFDITFSRSTKGDFIASVMDFTGTCSKYIKETL